MHRENSDHFVRIETMKDINMSDHILVTGGAGYVGSHVAGELSRQGHQVLVFDNLQTGHRAAVPSEAQFIEGDLADKDIVLRLFAENRIDAIMHFAANTLPGESMEKPFLYLRNDLVNVLNLLEASILYNVDRFVFSSTANLFSCQGSEAITEDRSIVPGSPYGESKRIIERILYWMDRTHGVRSACLRYFNAAGAALDFARGEDHRPEHHLIPIIMQAALGQRRHVEIFGDDYDTCDGTCVRDYVHVVDLAAAHVLCLGALKQGSCTYNIGNGKGYSVRAVIDAARRVTGAAIPVVVGRRRPGDPAVLVADSSKIRDELGWVPRYSDLKSILSSAWQWHRAHPDGYNRS